MLLEHPSYSFIARTVIDTVHNLAALYGEKHPDFYSVRNALQTAPELYPEIERLVEDKADGFAERTIKSHLRITFRQHGLDNLIK